MAYSYSKKPLLIGGIITYLSGSIATYLYIDSHRDLCKKSDSSTKVVEGCPFDSIAEKYDKAIAGDELIMGITLLRRYFVWGAKGKVLEVACGTGRNFSYYRQGADVTAIDCSSAMVEKAKTKAMALSSKAAISVLQLSAENLPYEDASFDFVIDSFGLCSVADPVNVLREMGRVCKPDGRILLLEHGKSNYAFMNKLLDKGEIEHEKKWHCKWNRPIDELVHTAGLEIERMSRFHFGTTFLLVLSVPRVKHDRDFASFTI